MAQDRRVAIDRPRLRRAAARHRVRRGRPRGRGHRRLAGPRRGAQRPATPRSTTSPTSGCGARWTRGLRVVAPADARSREADAIFVCVPTPITSTKDPDLGPVLSAAALIRDGLRAGQLVVLQSTTFPGTTTGPFREVLERPGSAPAATSISPSRPSGSTRAIRRAPAAASRASWAARRPRRRERAAALLRAHQRPGRRSCPRRTRPSWRSSSRTSSATSTSRSSTSSPCSASGWASTSGRSSTPRRPSRSASCASRPGPGVGGHCIPVDPYYLSWRAREFDFIDRFIELAGDINFGDAAPRRRPRGGGAQRSRQGAQGRAGRRRSGVAFKPNVQDARNSPAAAILAGLIARGRRGRATTTRCPAVPRRHGLRPRGRGPRRAAPRADVSSS